MIINTGARTDTVQYFSQWLLKRFEEGFVYSRNPLFPNKVIRYELTPDKVDCVIFCSKNYQPIINDITKITDKFNTYFYYTITPYGKDIEPNVPTIENSVETLKKLSEIVGKQRLAWRYDPVLLTKNYTIETHIKAFDKMAKEISLYVDRCIFSFVEMYKKLEVNMPEIIPLTDSDKNIIALNLGKIAKKYNLNIQTCATNTDYTEYGIHNSGCMTLDILDNANGVKFKNLKHKGTRKHCHCIESRDIGAYDTCLNGCKYCYANKNPKIAQKNYKFHNPNSPLLLGSLVETDEILLGAQKSFIDKKIQQKLF